MNPWEAREYKVPENACLVRNVLRFRTQLDLWLPFPQNACCFGFGDDSLPLPLGALFILWERWPALTGPCPMCGGKGYGVGFLGFLAKGWIPGVCIDCEVSLLRNVGGAGSLANEIRPILKGTPYYLHLGSLWGTIEGRRAPLVAALRSVGAVDLPSKGWTRKREGGGASLIVQTDEGPVSLSMEVDVSHPVPYDPTGGTPLPTARLSDGEAP